MKTAAWGVPIIAVAVATPASSASIFSVSVTATIQQYNYAYNILTLILLDSAGGGIAGLTPTIQGSADGVDFADIAPGNDTDDNGDSMTYVLNAPESYSAYGFYRAYFNVYGTTHYSNIVINL